MDGNVELSAAAPHAPCAEPTGTPPSSCATMSPPIVNDAADDAEHKQIDDAASPKRRKTTPVAPPGPPPTLRIATYFGAFDPVHENHVRQVAAQLWPFISLHSSAPQALAACLRFSIDACFFCPNADQVRALSAEPF